MNRLTRITVPMLALLTLAGVVIGVPILLIALVGWPVPSPMPTPDEIGDIFAGRTPIPADYLIALLSIAMWIIWAQVLWATVIECSAAFGGRMAKRARMIPGVQLGVAKLVTAATLLATSFTVKPASAGPLMPVAALVVDGGPASAGMAELSASAESDDIAQIRQERSQTVPYMTKPGDTWWGIAEEALGSGTRWKEIRGLNLGRTMEDGTVIAAGTDLLRPDWRLLLPRTGDPVGAVREVTVERGDTIWGIAEEDLAAADGDNTMAAVAEHVGEISSLNRAELNGNPDMIYPGQRLQLPKQPLAERPPTPQPDVAPPEPTTPSVPPSTAPSTAAPTTVPTTTQAPTTQAPTTAAPTTQAPTTAAPTTAAPTTQASTTQAPTTTAPPSTRAAVTPAPIPSAPPLPPTTTGLEQPPTSSGRIEPADPGVETEARPGPVPEIIGEGEQAADEDRPKSLAGARAATAGADQPRPLSLETSDRLDLEDDDESERSPSQGGDFRQGSAVVGTDDDSATRDGAGDDLQAGGQVTASELASDEVQEDGDEPGTDGSRAPTVVGLAALTLIGAHLYRARGRRRETALRHRHPGRRPSPPKRRTRGVARRLAAAAEPEHGEFVNIGLRALSRRLQGVPADRLPKISGVWVSHNRLVLALADNSPKSVPPEPFTEFADGSGWSLRRSDFGRARQVAKGANGPLPLLTTIGTTTALDLALTTNSRAPAEAYGLSSTLLFALDLEAGRVISVQAEDESSTIEALTMMALELATSETADQAEIVCVGFGHRLATFDRVLVVEELSEVLPDVEAITGRAEYAAGDASPFATRVGNGAADTWNPVVVFHADPNDRHAATLVELAGRTDGGVTAVCGYPTTLGWKLQVYGDHISCSDLPGDLSRHTFKRPELDGVELIPDLFDEPWDDMELDDDFWKPMDPVEAEHTWHHSDGDSSWRPMRSVTDPDRVEEDDGPDSNSAIAVVVNQESPQVGRQSPEDLWDSISTVDPDSWPENEIPALKELRHSVEHVAPEESDGIGDSDDWFHPDMDVPPWVNEPRSERLVDRPPPPEPPTRGIGDLDGDDGEPGPPGDRDFGDGNFGDGPAGRDGDPADEPVQENPSDSEQTADDPGIDVGTDEAVDASIDEAPKTETDVDVEVDIEEDTEAEVAGTVDAGDGEDPGQIADDVDDDDDSGSASNRSRHLYIVGKADDEQSGSEEASADGAASDSGVTADPQPPTGTDDGAESSTAEAGNVDPAPLDQPAVAERDESGDIRISVLGNFTVGAHHVGERSKPWKYTKTPELLLYLLLHPAGASQDLLMEQLFPEQPPNRPRLNQLVSDARTKALGKNGDDQYHLPHASPTEPFYKLQPSVRLDLRDFAQHCADARAAESLQVQAREWEAALKLVKGRPFTLPHDGYEWAVPEIEATIIKVEEAAAALTDIAFELGDYRLAVWATKQGLLTGTGYYELLVKRGRAALMLQDPEEIVRAFADLQVSLEYSGAPEEGMPDLSSHPDLEQVYNDLSTEGRNKDRPET